MMAAKVQLSGQRATAGGMLSASEAMIADSFRPLPAMYSSVEHTVLRITVPPTGTDTADLFLSSATSERLAELPALSQVDQ